MTSNSQFTIDFEYFDRLEQFRVNKDRIYNILGAIPLISTLSSIVRQIDCDQTMSREMNTYAEHYSAAIAAKHVPLADKQASKQEIEYHTFYANKHFELRDIAYENGCLGLAGLFPLIGNVAHLALLAIGTREKYQVEMAPNETLFERYKTFGAQRLFFPLSEDGRNIIQEMIDAKKRARQDAIAGKQAA